MNADNTQDPVVRPLVTERPHADEHQLQRALEFLHKKNAELLAVEAFIIGHRAELAGLSWSVNSWMHEANGITIYYWHPGESCYSPTTPNPDEIARRFPGEWKTEMSHSGNLNLKAVRAGVTLIIHGYTAPAASRKDGAGQVITF